MFARTPIARTQKNRGTSLLSAIALFALASTVTVFGCRSSQPEAASQPVSTAPSAPPKRQPVTTPPAVQKHLYSAQADPKADIAAALKQAGLEHKRVILDFGGDWCGDCQVLDIYFHQSPNLELLDKNFRPRPHRHRPLRQKPRHSRKVQCPAQEGVPALAVLDSNGKLLYSQQTAEFGDMRYMYVHLRHRFPQPVEGLATSSSSTPRAAPMRRLLRLPASCMALSFAQDGTTA